MKTIILSIFFASIFALVITDTSAQNVAETAKQQKEINKYSREQLNQKASKDARKEAKRYKKEGWTVVPGALPVEKQLDKAYMMQYERDDDGYPKFVMGNAMSIGENYDAARLQAQELAKLDLAGQIQSEITALIENSLANKQLAAGEAASITETVAANKNLISQSIGRTINMVEMYRTLPNKNKEVMVRVAYNSRMAKEAAKNAIRGELQKKGEDLQNKLDKILGL